MIKITFIHKENELLNTFLTRAFNEANLEGYKVDFLVMNESLIERYEITKYHTVIFEDFKNREITRIEGPFNAAQLEETLQLAIGSLANRLKGEIL